jgi:phosphoglycolate phosphatase
MSAFRLPFDEDLYRQHYAADWRVMYERLGLREDQIHEANALWQAAYDGIETTELFRGVAQALRRLAAAGVPLGLVTAGPSPIVGPQITRLELDELLRVRVYGDDLLEQKPDPAPLRLALDRLQFGGDVRAVAYLGDAPDDMRMACALGVHGVGVPSRLSSAEQLRDAGAEDIVDSVAEWVARALLDVPAHS